MSETPQPPGRVVITHKAIATLASQAALRPTVSRGWRRQLRTDRLPARTRSPRCEIWMVEASASTASSSSTARGLVRGRQVAHTVRYQVERASGMPIRVNIHVQDLRVSNADWSARGQPA
jgi:hypothetical protein